MISFAIVNDLRKSGSAAKNDAGLTSSSFFNLNNNTSANYSKNYPKNLHLYILTFFKILVKKKKHR